MTTFVPEQRLLDTFGALKAEDLGGRIFELFAKPSYFPALESVRSCVLVGGRGTGKTTVLRGLSYEGQSVLREGAAVATWPYYGLYYRVNTTRVRAFTRGDLSEDEWLRLFGHYLNLSLVLLVARFLSWYEEKEQTRVDLEPRLVSRVCSSLHLAPTEHVSGLVQVCEDGLAQFESSLNNIRSLSQLPVSMSAQPLETLMEGLNVAPGFVGKQFFFLIDEYENFLDGQQRLVNTMIKHRGQNYSFKVGVREMGWRVRTTLDPEEHVTDPADYVRIDIDSHLAEGSRFGEFAREVCQFRLNQLQQPGASRFVIDDVQQLLPGLSIEDEAVRLGVVDRARTIRAGHPELMLDEIPSLELFILDRWASTEDSSLAKQVKDYLDEPQKWRVRVENYRYAALFSLREGLRGIRKYYSGWDTLTLLAGGNIRYLLELVEQSLAQQWQQVRDWAQPIDPDVQTDAAIAVGLKNLTELQGNERHGAELMRIVLSLGRIFGVMATDPWGHAPEVNEFRIKPGGVSSAESQRVDELANAAIRLLALKRSPGSKPGPVTDTKDFDYRLHPIFTAYFGFSHRKKRRMTITEREFLGLSDSHRSAISSIVRRTQRDPEAEPLPDQLRLFGQFFDA